MNLIVFDLEWNQCPSGKDHEMKGLPFEIIEIGAVKLNEQKEIIDTFRVLVKPVVYRRLHPIIRGVVGLSMMELNRDGIPFQEAARKFLAWCGDDVRFCTWGTLDLTEFQKNLRWFQMEEELKGPILYEDVQKLFAISYETKKVRRALNWAVEYLKLPEDREYHMALSDAWYTAKVLQTIPDHIIERYYSIDCYQNPKSRKEEIRLQFPTYEKFISKEFSSKEKLMGDRVVTAVHCFQCGKNTKRLVRWFSCGSRNYLAAGNCAEHGLVKSKIRIRKTDDETFYAIRTTKMITQEDLDNIKQKRGHLRIKRRQKRLNQSQISN